MTRLDLLRPTQTAVVASVQGVAGVVQRLMARGILPGVRVELTRQAPLGGPIAIRLHGYELSLRRCDAAGVAVQVA